MNLDDITRVALNFLPVAKSSGQWFIIVRLSWRRRGSTEQFKMMKNRNPVPVS